MMATCTKASREGKLSTGETIGSCQIWKQHLQYILSLDPIISPLIGEDVTWEKRTSNNPTRGYTDDGENVPEATRKTTAQKVASLELIWV